MSTEYKHGFEVPTKVLITRLDELAEAITKGKGAIDREFTMSVPAQLDRDADAILSEAAKRLLELERIERDRDYWKLSFNKEIKAKRA